MGDVGERGRNSRKDEERRGEGRDLVRSGRCVGRTVAGSSLVTSRDAQHEDTCLGSRSALMASVISDEAGSNLVS